MKFSRVFFSTLIAASAMTANAYAEVAPTQSEDTFQLSFSGSIDQMVPGENNDSSYTLTFDGVTGGYFGTGANSDETFKQNIVINGLVSSNGYGAHVTTFTGTVTGEGNFTIKDYGLGQDFVFTGDVSGYSGNISSSQLYNSNEDNFSTALKNTKSGVIQFGSIQAVAATATTNISGTGSISTTGVLRYNYADGVGPLTIGNSSVSAAALEFRGGASYVLNSDTTVSHVLNLSGGSSVTIGSGKTLSFNSGAAVRVEGVGVVSSNEIKSALSAFGDLVEAGLQTVTLEKEFQFIQGEGSVSGLTAQNVIIDGLTVGRLSDDSKTAISLTGSVYNVVSGETVYSDVSESNFVNIKGNGILNVGTVTSNTFSLTDNIFGNGTIKIDANSSANGYTGHMIVTIGDNFEGTAAFTGRVDVGELDVGSASSIVFGSTEEGLTETNLWSGSAATIASDVDFSGTTTIHNKSGKLTFGGKVSGNGTIVGKASQLSISAFENWSGTVDLSEENYNSKTAVDLCGYGTKGSNIVVKGLSGNDVYLTDGVVNANVKFDGDVALTDGSSSRTIEFSGDITGTGDFKFVGTRAVGESYHFSGDVSGYEGSFVRETGSSTTGQNRLTFGGEYSNESGIKGATGKSVSGTGEIAWGTSYEVIYNYSNDVFASNTITGGALVKKGIGSLELTGNNSYSGGTTIEKGALVASNTRALGSGNVTVKGDATLKLAVAVENVGNVSLEEGAMFAIDVTGMSPVSMMANGNETVALSILSSSALSFNGQDASSLSSDTIDGYFDDKNSNLGQWSEWQREWSYQNGALNLTLTIPEPSAFGLLAGVGALALVASRRRRVKKA